MTPMALIDYGLILIFFIGVAGLVLVIARPHPAEEKATNAISSPQKEAPNYAILAALFALLIVATIFARREPSHVSSS
jgi:hypothetical protein